MATSDSVNRVAIVGAGTMGAGIALAALYAGIPVGLFDVSEAVIASAEAYIDKFLAKKGLSKNKRLLQLSRRMSDLSDCDLWIEAVPESLQLKRDVFGQVQAAAQSAAVLATNTSTLSVAEIAAAIKQPARVIGLHFFNPAAVMPLVEIVTTRSTPPQVEALAQSFVRQLGKTGVRVADSPGFIVNRVARPYYGESLRLLGEGVCGHTEIDAVLEGVGFRMGPFRLMDLIGIDVNLAAVRSMFEQSGGEPRYQPHPIQEQMVENGHLGQKTGKGFYSYPAHPPGEDDANPASEIPVGPTFALAGPQSPGLLRLLAAAGVEAAARPDGAQAAVLAPPATDSGSEALAAVDAALPKTAPLLVQSTTRRLADWAEGVAHPGRLIGYEGLFLPTAKAIPLTAQSECPVEIRARAEALLSRLGKRAIWVEDSPGMVAARVICQIFNEAAFAVEDGVADTATIDTAMQLGANYPHGPFAWADELGASTVVAVMEHVLREFDEPRYRLSPWLRRRAAESNG